MFTFPDGTPPEVVALVTPEVEETARLERASILRDGMKYHESEPCTDDGSGRLMVVVQPNGATHLLHMGDDDRRCYDLMSSAVEGLIEFVPVRGDLFGDDQPPLTMIVNEEFTYTTGTDGRRLPLNLFASTMAGQAIFGTVVVTFAHPDEVGNTRGLDSVSASAIRWVLAFMFPIATIDDVPVSARTHRLQPDDDAPAGITVEPWLTLEDILQG